MRPLILLSLSCLALTGCGALLMTDGEAETRHRYYAVYSDDLQAVAVADESYLWDCGGTMGRCYDRESDHNFALFRVDPSDSTRVDTLARVRGGSTFTGGYDNPVLFLSLKKNLLLHAHTDSAHQWHLILSDAMGKGEFDLRDLPGMRDRYLMAITPNPGFTLAAAVGHGKAGESVVFFFDLEKRILADSVVIPRSPEDTTAQFGRGSLWESDSSLIVYGKGGFTYEGLVAYRIRNGRLTDTIPDFGCLPYLATSSGPGDTGGNTLTWTGTGLSRKARETWRCQP